ncbi:GIY-YIG nuclease family protein [Patescibacteria group bacterium]|nr:GIY-YIG nuclease family protein [Patescibacteria group bacterium]MBU1124027.1 GIY-YIG nuclease family protein [Patescibacteria group bacterium]MBU1911278.1 GIY-YIG nuclease family protein [Patescibacteria group bacterium]
MRQVEWHVYIAQARTGRYYTGITTDTGKRIQTHNKGKGAKFAHDQGNLTLVYESTPFKTKSEVRKREIQIKGWTREKKEKLIRGEWK